MAAPTERPRGILTRKDRSLLLGEIEYEHKQQYSNRRQDIRERITNGILDFSSIQYLLQDKDRKRIFSAPAEAAGVDDAQFHESIRAMLYWVYLGLKEQNYDFGSLLEAAIVEAEQDFARKYWGDSVDIRVDFDVSVSRSNDLDALISSIEQGGPVKANRIYDLLEMSGGVPIDTSEVDTLRVHFKSSYPKGEKAVIEAVFSEYLGVKVEVEEVIDRVGPIHKENLQKDAVVDPDRSRPAPHEIPNYSPTTDYTVDESDLMGVSFGKQSPQSRNTNDTPGEDESILENKIDEMMAEADERQPSIHELANEEAERSTEPVTPETALNILKQVNDQFVSTIEIAAACDCAPDAARQALSELFEEKQVNTRLVADNNGGRLAIWWLRG